LLREDGAVSGFRAQGNRYLLGIRYPRARRIWRWLTAPIRRRRSRRERDLAAAFVGQFGTTVRSGPFAGLDCSTVARPSYRLIRRLLGSFEEELQPALAEVVDRGYDTAINVGCSTGYYVVGLALAMPQAIVHGFETSERQRSQVRELAQANGVADRVLLYGTCDPVALSRVEGSEPFVLCDCEGCEVDVLDPAAVPSLRSATLIVELHDHLQPGTTEIVLGRFADSHDATLISSRPRNPAGYQELRGLSRRDAARVLGERPLPMRWAYLTPRGGSDQRTRSTG
jgi:hypothetical protein